MSNLVESCRSIESEPIRAEAWAANPVEKTKQIMNKHRTAPFELNRVSKIVELWHGKRIAGDEAVESCRIIAEDTCQPRASVAKHVQKANRIRKKPCTACIGAFLCRNLSKRVTVF